MFLGFSNPTELLRIFYTEKKENPTWGHFISYLYCSVFLVSKFGRTIIARYDRMNCTTEPAAV